MSHIALYRAWRPQTFQDMVGQQHIIQTLQNSIREQRVSHAYLFNGPRGTGKTSAAKILAKAVNCERGPVEEPCNECDACIGITAGHIMDVIEIDAASNRGIDEIRDIRDKVRYAPSEVRFKVYIIDEVHMLTAEAFNALLKTLEEPPGHVIFILATTEPHKLPATIISRCQRFDFRQVSLEEQTQHLLKICREESIQADEDALAYIARLSEGGMRDAISLLEQVSAFAGDRITLDAAVDVTGGMAADHFYQLAEAVKDRHVAAVMPLVESLMQAGKSADKCMENLIYYFRDLLVMKLAPQGGAVTERIVDPERFKMMAEAFTPERLFAMIDTLNRYQVELKHASQPQTLFEVALMKLCTLNDEQSSGGAASASTAASASSGGQSAEVGRLRQQIEALERKLEQAIQNGVGSGNNASSADSAASKQAARTNAVRSSFGGSGGIVRSSVKLDPYLATAGSPEFNQFRMKWNDVLQGVKDAKITVHAWLKDGEPVASADDAILVAFKNTMHRETTEKPANREIIEKVMHDVLGGSFRIVTVMMKDWQAAAAQGASTQKSETLQLEPESSASPQAASRPVWVEEAVKLFGEDLVVVKDKD
ncbi:DNA polymerase III subunit gamma/tau [Paenibacillus sp. FSL A5-0031]|uniref:DNA polymerase III subunit gamma/tau n=1 Tax=Paenibacillus sp. FSL A5-0031 TaxID=1920420 RepID=UPI00096F7177|nr:DNA polymerase III subunit gamma/tau [Paenibacillus sp. FSL A5-0031]OME74065.1 DNA polymerase III subunit gamma/tau [Paenibacillus sp. FSL A5-0031]